MEEEDRYSKIIAGTMTWGSWGKQFSTAQMTDMIQYCFGMGLTTFDHADIYGDYTNEASFGTAFLQSGVPRDKVQLITKCGIQFDAETRPNRVKHYEYGKAYIISSVERSLKSLQTDYVDMLLLHRPSPLMHPGEIGEAIRTLQKAGKIRSFGVSNFSPSQIAVLETELPVMGNQVEFSLTADEVLYDGTLDDCLAHERMAMSWSPLGAFFREKTERTARIRKAMEPMTEAYGASYDQLLLAWIMKHPANVYPVVGTATKERLADALKAATITMDLQDWFILHEASRGQEVP